MTIDERLDRLTMRHEALAESLELLTASVHEQSGNIDKLRAAQDVDREERKQAEKRLDARVDTVLNMVTMLAAAADGMLGHTAGPEVRITKLEGGAQ